MKAVRFAEFGAASTLRWEEVERPVPAPGEVLVEVAGTSFNRVDAVIRGGELRQVFGVALPHIPGIDVAGTVAALGPGVGGVGVGDPVVGLLPGLTGQGTAAEYVVVPAEVLTGAPKAVPLPDAAVLPAVGLTAWQAVFEHAEVLAGQRVLVTGAGGAVGGFAVQLAAQAGATVVAATSTQHVERLRGYGAAEVVERGSGGPAGEFDAVLNFAPGTPDDLAALAARVRPGGVLITTTTDVPDGTGVRWLHMYVHSDAGQLAQLVDRIDAGRVHIHVAERVPLERLADVHARHDAGELLGKIVAVV